MKRLTLFVLAFSVAMSAMQQGRAARFDTGVAQQDSNITITVGDVSFTMVYVEGGLFTMGCTPEQGWYDCENDEKPPHGVILSDYYIGETEVTQALWRAVMGTTISQQRDKCDSSWAVFEEGDDYPMYYVSWDDCQEFIARLDSITGLTFRLPTEAEWEFAARGGNKSEEYRYSGSNDIDSVAWYLERKSHLHPVGQKKANELGLYDMSGNLQEWCSDWYERYRYNADSLRDPQGPEEAPISFKRITRGGSYITDANSCRVAFRFPYTYYFCNYFIGFRLALSR